MGAFEEHDESVLVGKEPCPACGSSDNLARYSDGHAHCFGQGCGHHEHADGDGDYEREYIPMNDELINDGEYQALRKRGLTEETCRRYGYQTGTFKGSPVHIAQYRDAHGTITGQKLRFPDKKEGMPWLGDGRKPPLFGEWITVKGSRRVVVTEGELDAMAVSQATGNKWPVVSIPLGVADAAKCFTRSLAYLSQFDQVVILFDMDEAGQEAALEAARILPPGKAAIASLPLKDASDMLMAGRIGELVDATFSAVPYTPAGLVKFGDLKDKMKDPIKWGIPWFSDALTSATYGRRTGEIYMLGAGTGIGKTDLLTQQIDYDVTTLDEKVCLFFFEQEPVETGKRLAGKVAGKRFHIPRLQDKPGAELPDDYVPEWTDQELDEAIDRLDTNENISFYDSFGACDWEKAEEMIRYQHHSNGCKIFYLDHLTALAAAEEDERKGLERITASMGALVKEIPIILIVISHLATPEGKPHEEGGRVMIRHFKGSRAIGFWAHYMFGMERDQHHVDPEMRSITTFRILKDRYTGNATGECIYFGYNIDTGQLYETELPEMDEDGFTKEADGFDSPSF